MELIQGLFAALVGILIIQRLFELHVAKRNTARLMAQGAVEWGHGHYPVIVGMHVLFFICLFAEGFFGYLEWNPLSIVWFALFLIAQAGRIWIQKTMSGRWTTRVLVRPRESPIEGGPFRYLRHPNYVVVALELSALPMIFSLYVTAIVFTALNAIVLLAVRIPLERKAWREIGRAQ